MVAALTARRRCSPLIALIVGLLHAIDQCFAGLAAQTKAGTDASGRRATPPRVNLADQLGPPSKLPGKFATPLRRMPKIPAPVILARKRPAPTRPPPAH